MENRFDGTQESRDAGRSSNSLVWLIGQMLRLPFVAFSYSMEMFAKTMQGITRMADQSIGSIVSDGTQTSADKGSERKPGGESAISANQCAISDSAATTEKEKSKMGEQNFGRDQDLSGDDLKDVSYSIIFTKPDLEGTLQKDTPDLVTYSTTGPSYAGIKLVDFFVGLSAHPIDRPDSWKRNGYPNGATGDKWNGTPPLDPDDKRYVEFVYWVDRRVPKNAANYDKEQVKVLREIRDELKHKAAK